MKKTASFSLIVAALVGTLGLSACDKKPPTPTAESPSAAPMPAAPASRASAP